MLINCIVVGGFNCKDINNNTDYHFYNYKVSGVHEDSPVDYHLKTILKQISISKYRCNKKMSANELRRLYSKLQLKSAPKSKAELVTAPEEGILLSDSRIKAEAAKLQINGLERKKNIGFYCGQTIIVRPVHRPTMPKRRIGNAD